MRMKESILLRAILLSGLLAACHGCGAQSPSAPNGSNPGGGGTGGAANYARTPVLFVHGHGLNSGTWQLLITKLIEQGYPREYLHAIDIVPPTMPNVAAATNVIDPAASTLLTNAQAAARQGGFQGPLPQKLDIVSHSMGAVSSRWFAAKLHPERVRTWLSLAGASHGTNALCDYGDPASREMCPAFSGIHPVQVELNGTPQSPMDETPYGLGVDRAGVPSIGPSGSRSILYLSVRVDPDFWIQPGESAIVDGAGGAAGAPAPPPGLSIQESSAGNYVINELIGHDLPNHPAVVSFVAALLTARDR
jgi:pimeloyl-ACP methyl ester carboxylesterase